MNRVNIAIDGPAGAPRDPRHLLSVRLGDLRIAPSVGATFHSCPWGNMQRVMLKLTGGYENNV